MVKDKQYTVSDGVLVLALELADEGGCAVMSPMDPELITESDSIEEAFANARDAAESLRSSRAKLMQQLQLEKRIKL
jgi:predicted RNase H-like HicB family nuclease